MKSADTRENRSYRAVLKEKLAERCDRNSRYSLTAFARDLEISTPRLSNVLNGNFGLSRDAAAKIAKKLGMSNEETTCFCDLVESEHARGKIKRISAQKRLQSQNQHFNDLTLEHFKVVSDWYHFAIMELTLVSDFQFDFNWIAKRLKISRHVAQAAVERLLRLELIEKKNGSLNITGNYFVNDVGIPSDSIKKFHIQVLEKAKSALMYQTIDERDFRSITVAVDRSDIPKAKAMIKEFANELDRELSKGITKSEVYHFSVQFFSAEQSPIADSDSVKFLKEGSQS